MMQSIPEQMEVDTQNGASDDSLSDSDDSDYEEVEVSMEDMANITKLETELESNPNIYDVHLQYIALLRKCKMKERARTAREAMHTRFPFSESLWLEWLQDELQESEADHSRMQHLFELATQDYLSTKIWVMYISWAAAMAAAQGTKDNCERARDVGERAVTAGGLHVAEGSTIWDAYRDFELQHLAQHPEDEKQVQRVRSLFLRQLQVPLMGNEEILKAHEEWEAQQSKPQTLPPHVHAQYKKAQAAVQQRQAHEEAVAPGKEANEELLAAYMTYIQLEQEQGQPARVTVVYERAVAMFPVTHLLWQQYAAYLQGNLKVHSVINKVYERAVQNCPWVGVLWAGSLRALERAGCSDEEHRSQHEKALQAGLQTAEDYTEVLLARIDFLRRKGKEAYTETREAFKASQELLASYFPGWVDRSLVFVQYEAECALRLGDGIGEARSVWNAALKTPLNKFMDVWAGFISMEVAEQNIAAARGVYKRCYSHVLEDGSQAALCQAWVRFEREHGSAEEHLQALLKTTPIVERAAAEVMAAANAEAAAIAQAAAKKAAKLSPEEVRQMRQARDPHFKKGGAKGPASASAAEADAAAMPPPASRMPPKRKKGLGFQEPGAKRQRNEGGAPADGAAEAQGTSEAAAVDGEAAAPAFASAGAQDVSTINDTGDTMPPVQDGPAAEAEEKVDSAEASTSGRPFYTDECTAFVRGLPQNLEDGELDELFADSGGLKEIRIQRDSQTGQAKGFAYAEFESKEALDRAVAKSGMRFKGRELFIAVSRPKGGGARGGMRGRGRSFGDSNRGGRFQGRDNSRGGRRGGGRGRGRNSGDRNWQIGGNRGAPIGEGKGPGHHSVHLDLNGPPKGSTAAAAASADGSTQQKKSNADFRNMFLKGGKL